MKTVVFYFTQSGQALEAAKSICRPLDNSEDTVIYKPIVSQKPYPFPWSSESFYGIFPETRLGLPPIGIETFNYDDILDADLVMVVGQSWFLSPSVPLQSFFTHPQVIEYLNGRDVVFVNACRNMWLNTLYRIKDYIKNANARLVGHIVLQDKTPNLISVITIIRWLVYGKKTSRFLPPAGVSQDDLKNAEVFGEIIKGTPRNILQKKLLESGAIDYKPSVLFVEKVGHRMFGLWAKFIRKKGEYGNPKRKFRIKLFNIYLMIVLFLVSPFGVLFFWLTYPFRNIAAQRQSDCNLDENFKD